MRFSTRSVLSSLVLTAGLLNCGIACAQQASFAVSVTLHAVAKPMSAAQLCPEGKPMDILGATVRVQCPVVAKADASPAGRAESSSQINTPRHPEVTVTF
jgi:hypothetical protein